MALNSNFRTLTADNIEGIVEDRNYLKSSFENGTITGWTEVSVALTSGLPTGTPTISSTAASSLALSATSVTPLSGSRSLLVDVPSALTAGHGFISDEFTLDRMDLGKVLTVTFDYERVTGTYNFSGTLGSQTWMVYIYDATLGAANWIQPAGFLGMNQSSGPGRVTATFQSSVVAGQKYRVAVIASQAVGSACSIEFDNFTCSRVTAPIGQLRNPAGTIISTGSLTPPNGYLYCNGSAISRADYSELFSAIGTTYGTGNGTTTFNIPDLRGIFPRGAGTNPSNAANTTTMGNRQLDDFKSHNHTSTPIQVGGGTFTTSGNYLGQNGPSAAGPGTQSTGGTETRPANLGVAYHICFSSGSVQMSSDTDTRVVAMRATVSAGQTFTAVAGGSANKLTYGSVTSDTHGAYNSTTSTYTIPVSGYYRFQAMLYLNAVSQASGNFNEISATINGGAISFRLSRLLQYLVNGDISLNGSSIYYLSAGSTVEFYWGPGAITTATKVLDQGLNYISIERFSGPSVIAASEVVEATYQALAGNVMNNGTEMWLDYGTKIRDTHNSVSGAGSGNKTVSNAGWKFTAPITGRYYVNAVFHVTSGAVANSVTYGYIAVNGSAKSHSDIKAGQNPVGDAFGSQINGEVFMNAGDYLEIVGYQANGANRNQQVVNIRNQVEIVRVGAY